MNYFMYLQYYVYFIFFTLNQEIIWNIFKSSGHTFNGDNFVKNKFVSLLERGLLLKESICSQWEQMLSF